MAKDYKYRARRAQKEASLMEFEGMHRDQLLDMILKLREENEELHERIESEVAQASKYDTQDFRQEWSLPTKVTFLLHLENKPLTSEDLHNKLLDLDSHYKDYDSPKMNLTTTLKRVTANGRVAKIKLPGVRELIYALPEWVDKEGKLTVDYSYFQK